uniref:growth-regulating factor 12-like n=1 Tax=Erigeron canadensis TaxID=72917 RepID=UPI001CB8B24C|nr:growth-regulating factor 12-like [Erigeron canadensis]
MNGVKNSSNYSSDYMSTNNNMNGGFTFMQMEELKLQALIYKYIEAGLPVPSHLILPIWNSVLASLAGSGYDRNLYDSYKSSMEAEPGRCKRTDGKKWRCSKEVFVGHKYCEKHLHRGRSRSTSKDVENNDAVVATTTTTNVLDPKKYMNTKNDIRN